MSILVAATPNARLVERCKESINDIREGPVLAKCHVDCEGASTACS